MDNVTVELSRVAELPPNSTDGTMELNMLTERLRCLHRDESGQDLIEYALVAALIAFAAVAAMNTLANNINNAFSAIGSKLASAIS
jgi:pilus assembly protein Flp/PilA